MAKHPQVFDTRYTSVVEVGEHTGSLANALEQLADTLARGHEAAQRFKRTMMMPAFTMGASIAMLILMMTVMLPPLLDAFSSRGTEIPLLTRIASAVVGAISDNLIYIGLGIVAVFVFFLIIRSFPKSQYILHRVMIRLPIFGSLIVTREMAQFSRTNAMLLEAGVQGPDGRDGQDGPRLQSRPIRRLPQGRRFGRRRGPSGCIHPAHDQGSDRSDLGAWGRHQNRSPSGTAPGHQ